MTWSDISLLSLIVIFLSGFLTNGYSQNGPEPTVLKNSPGSIENEPPHLLYYIPGANFGSHGNVNVFTRTYCERMSAIMDTKFHVVKCSNRPYAISNVLWALWHGQHPMKNPMRDSRIRHSVKELLSDSLLHKSHITLVSSSYGTVVAAQLALCLVKGSQDLGLQPEPVNLVLGCSMLSKQSELFRELEKARQENKIGTLIYDELQYPGDNVTGMCGTTRLFAFAEVCRIAFPFLGKYHGQPSILNKDPITGHIHRKREISGDKVDDFIYTALVNYQLAGSLHKTKALESLSR